MPGPRAPCDYSKEPPRHPILLINSKEPFNAEPPRLSLISSYVTPVDFFYKRNHGPVPIVDDIESYRVCIGGLVEKPIELSMADIKKLPKYNVTATLQCAGNRRTAMSKVRAVKGVGWDISAIGNGGKHVEFVSVDMCKEEKGGPFKASIPLIQSTNSEADVLLAYEMNGELLNRDHGYPLRVVVPGVIGAHSVKWLDSINIIGEECQGFFMQKDYKMFPSSVKWENIDWSTQKPQMDFPVQSAICSLEDDNTVQHGKVKVHGYAASGGGRAALKDSMYHLMVARHGWKHPDTKRVEFHIMLLLMMINIVTNGHGCFLKLKVMSSTIQRLLPKLLTAANVQPENVAVIWNLRGILNNSWHRIQIHVKDK